MIKFYLYNRQTILNAILFIALILALIFNDGAPRDFWLGFATSIAFINFVNGFSRNKKQVSAISKD